MGWRVRKWPAHMCWDLRMVTACCLSPWRPILSRRLTKQGFTSPACQLDPTGTNTMVGLFWVNYNNSPTWIKAIWWWFPLLSMIPVRSQWGRYNLPRLLMIIVAHVVMLPRHAKIHGTVFTTKFPRLFPVWSGRDLQAICLYHWRKEWIAGDLVVASGCISLIPTKAQ